jgi:sugar lactone lactonase YvrE
MKCPYCGDSIVIPQDARTFTSSPVAFNTFNQANTFSPPTFTGETYTSKVNRTPMFMVGGVIAALVVCVVAAVIGYFMLGSNGVNPVAAMFFGNQVLSFGSKGIGQGMFQDARALGVDGSGNIVVADYEDGRVQIFTPAGKFSSLFTISADGKKPSLATGLAVSRDGTIYISTGNVILVYNESGQPLGRIGDSGHSYDDVTLGADGTLYALSEDTIVRFKQDSSVDLEIPGAVSNITGSPGGFSYLAVDGLGNMYITNDDAYAVFKYSPSGKFISQFGSESSDPSQFTGGKFISPLAIAVDGYGRIFVSDGDTIQVFDSSGKYLNNISGSFYGMTFDAQSNLYATSVSDTNVVKFKVQAPANVTPVAVSTSSASNNSPLPFANNILTFGSKGSGQGMFSESHSLGVDGKGNIIVADYTDGRIQTFDPTGKFISMFSLGSKESIFSLAVSPDGKIYAAHSGKITIFDSTGKQLQEIKDDQRFYQAVALGPDGTLYAATENDSIVRFDQKGKISLEITKAFENVTGEADSDTQIAVDSSGNIYYLGEDVNDLALKFGPDGKYISQFGGQTGGGQTGNGKFVSPTGIAVDGYGRIFVSDPFGDVQMFDSTGKFMNSFQASGYGVAVDSQNNVYVATGDQVEKFQVQKPSGQ